MGSCRLPLAGGESFILAGSSFLVHVVPKMMSIGLLAAAGEVVTDERTDGKNHRPLLWILVASTKVARPGWAGFKPLTHSVSTDQLLQFTTHLSGIKCSGYKDFETVC